MIGKFWPRKPLKEFDEESKLEDEDYPIQGPDDAE
jgi:hypothetical protein